MQAVTVEFSVEAGVHAGDRYNVFAGVSAAGKPAAIDYNAPLTAEPLPVLPGVAGHPGWLQSEHLTAWLDDPAPDEPAGYWSVGLARDRPVVRYVTDGRFYLGAFTLAVRAVSAGGDEQSSGPTETITVNSAPRSPTNVTVSSYDSGNDQIVIGLTPPEQFTGV